MVVVWSTSRLDCGLRWVRQEGKGYLRFGLPISRNELELFLSGNNEVDAESVNCRLLKRYPPSPQQIINVHVSGLIKTSILYSEFYSEDCSDGL